MLYKYWEIFIDMGQKISKKMDEFLDKVDKLCWEYGYEIRPTIGGINENGEYNTITVGECGNTNGDMVRLINIDGDGRGK